MLSGIALAGLSVGVYFYLAYLENESLRAGARFRVNWLLAALYNAGGKPLAAGFFALVGAIVFGVGVVSLLRRASEISTDAPVSQQELTTMLMPALDFTAADLAANRQGLLTERQRDRLGGLRKQSGVATLVMGLIVVLTLAGIAAYVLFFAPTSAALMRDPTTRMLVPLVLGVVMVIAFGSLLASALRARGLGAGKISVVAGKVTLIARSMPIEHTLISKAVGQGARACSIKVGGKMFPVKESALNAFKHGAAYRFYYVKYAPVYVILSAEALGDA